MKAQANGTMEILTISREVCLSRNKLRPCASKYKLFLDHIEPMLIEDLFLVMLAALIHVFFSECV